MNQAPASRRTTAPLTVGVSSVLTIAVLYANWAGSTESPILAGLERPVEAFLDLGAALYENGGRALESIRIPGLVCLAALLVLDRQRRSPSRPGLRLSVALCLGWIAQSYLLDGYTWLSVVLYGTSAAVYVSGRELQQKTDPAHSRVEGPAILALLTLSIGASIYALDVYPDLYIDETAYMLAAHMQLGDLPPGPILEAPWQHHYRLPRFQAQFIPLGLQCAALELLSPGLFTTRLVAVVTSAFALLVAALSLRRLGARTMLWTVALCSFAPLWLAYSRTGLYVGISMLYAVLTFAALLRLYDRWNRRSAVTLGIMLGGSLFLYQLSWFGPILVFLSAAVTPEIWRRSHAPRTALVVIGTSLAVALPAAFAFETGLRAVSDQTFDARALWSTSTPPQENQLVVVTLPHSLDDSEVRKLVAEAEDLGLHAYLPVTNKGYRVLALGGSRDVLEAKLDELRGLGMRTLWDTTPANSALARLRTILSRLFAASGVESNGRFVDAPLVNPLLVPFLVLGVAEAWRRRRDPIMRILLVWTAGGALLPAVIGGALPRRAVLMLPFVHAIMALSVVAITGVFARQLGTGRVWGLLVAISLWAGVVATGSHIYFDRWEIRINPQEPKEKEPLTARRIYDIVQAENAGSRARRMSPQHSRLWLAKLLNGLPRERSVLMPDLTVKMPPFIGSVERQLILIAGWPWRDDREPPVVIPALTSEKVRAASCQAKTPLTWITFATQDQRELFRVLDRDFSHSSEIFGPYRIYHVERRRTGGCMRAGGGRQAG